MALPLNEVEKQALKKAFQSPDFCSAVRKYAEERTEFFKGKVLSEQNTVPQSVDDDVRRRAQQAIYGGQAKAYAAMYVELEKIATD